MQSPLGLALLWIVLCLRYSHHVSGMVASTLIPHVRKLWYL